MKTVGRAVYVSSNAAYHAAIEKAKAAYNAVAKAAQKAEADRIVAEGVFINAVHAAEATRNAAQRMRPTSMAKRGSSGV